MLYKDRVFIYQDANPAPGQSAFVGAFDKKTGKPLWMTPRSETVGWGTAVVINTGERDELIVSSQRRVAAYDPASGKELWTVRGMTSEVIPTPVVGHGLVFASSGRAGPTMAIRPGGSGDVTSHARGVELAARIAIRSVRPGRRRPALFDQRHAEHPDRV